MDDFSDMLRRAAADAAREAKVPSLFAEEPVSLTVFVQDRAYLGNPPLSPEQYNSVRHIERIYYPDTYKQLAKEFEGAKRSDRFHVGAKTAWREEKYWSQNIRMTNFHTLQWGKGSGKDHICRIASMRIAYLLLCLNSPQEYYGMPEQDTIHLLNVASNSAQAQQAFFIPITRAVKKGWFANRCQPKQNVVSFERNVEAVSGHSDAESQEGLNLLLGIADEIDAFRSKKEMSTRKGASAREPTKSAESILRMMRTSGSTRFPEVFKQVRISYPRYLGSTIQNLCAEAKADIKENPKTSRHFVSGPFATWEVNPRVKGKDAFADDYRTDPVMARAMYECKPSRAVNPYFRNTLAVDACFVPKREMPITVDYRREEHNGHAMWVPSYRFADDFYAVRGAVYAMHADLAVQGDRAGIAMAHVQKWTEHPSAVEDPDGVIYQVPEVRPAVKVDFVTSYSSDVSADPAREIQIRWARQLCMELIKRGFNIRRFTFDTFQSVDSMQILEAKGIESFKVSTQLSDEVWRNLRDVMYDGRVTIPRPEPTDDEPSFLLRDELFALSRLPNGRIDHPVDGSKDEADALACAVQGAIELGGAEEEGGERTHYEPGSFAIGTTFHLPLGINPRRAWVTAMDYQDPLELPRVI